MYSAVIIKNGGKTTEYRKEGPKKKNRYAAAPVYLLQHGLQIKKAKKL